MGPALPMELSENRKRLQTFLGHLLMDWTCIDVHYLEK
jgi:hypothetical protein